MNQLTNELCAKFHSEEISSNHHHNILNKTFQDNKTLHLVCFLKENYSFHYSLLLPLALNLSVRIILC